MNNQKDIIKTEEDKEIFLDAIANPPIANSKLSKAKDSHGKFIKKIN